MSKLEREVNVNRTLGNIIQAVRDFDTHESLLHHDQLEICIPQGFYRYAGVDSDPDRDWDSVDVRLIYYHRELKFSITLTEKSFVPNFAIVEYRVREAECVTEYRVLESVQLTIRDAKRFLIFLLAYFRCFDLSLKTKLSKLTTQTSSKSSIPAKVEGVHKNSKRQGVQEAELN